MPIRPAAAIVLTLLALGAAGCGSSSTETDGGENAPPGATAIRCASRGGGNARVRATAISCEEARRVARGWRAAAACAPASGASRGACTIGLYRCLAARTDRGLSVSCARPGRSVAFLAGGR